LKGANLLRKCDDIYVRQSVYVNPDLTPAQAQLAYEEQVRRSHKIEMHSNHEYTATTASTHQIDTDFTTIKSLHVSTDDSTLTCSTNSIATPLPGDCVS